MIELNTDCKPFLPILSDFLDCEVSDLEPLYFIAKEISESNERWGGGTVEPAVAQMLYILVRWLRPTTLLEVGTNYGYSTFFIARACYDMEHGDFWSIDIDPNFVREAQKKLVNYPASIIQMDSQSSDFVELCMSLRPDFVFLDASHEYEKTKRELEILWGAAKLFGGIICLHDIYSDGVSRVLKELGPKIYLEIPTQPNTGFGIIRI